MLLLLLPLRLLPVPGVAEFAPEPHGCCCWRVCCFPALCFDLQGFPDNCKASGDLTRFPSEGLSRLPFGDLSRFPSGALGFRCYCCYCCCWCGLRQLPRWTWV